MGRATTPIRPAAHLRHGCVSSVRLAALGRTSCLCLIRLGEPSVSSWAVFLTKLRALMQRLHPSPDLGGPGMGWGLCPFQSFAQRKRQSILNSLSIAEILIRLFLHPSACNPNMSPEDLFPPFLKHPENAQSTQGRRDFSSHVEGWRAGDWVLGGRQMQ